MVSNEFKRPGILFFLGGVRSVWLRTIWKHSRNALKALEDKVAQDGVFSLRHSYRYWKKQKWKNKSGDEIET